MQRLFVYLVAFYVCASSAFAQDVITLRNGNDVQALVQEVGEVEVKYKRLDNPSGPNYTLKKSDIFMINYANGSRDIFQQQGNTEADNQQPAASANVEREKAQYYPGYFTITAGKSAFGTVSYGEITKGGTFVLGVDGARFLNPYLGIGLKINLGFCEVDFGKDYYYNHYTHYYDEVVLFVGPALYGRFGKGRVALTAGAGCGMLWTWWNSWVYHVSDSYQRASSIGGMLSTGVNFMLSKNFGIDINVQSVFGTVKNTDSFERNPSGLGVTLGFNFRFDTE